MNSSFRFYSVLKNEDAMPYIGGDLLAVADGLGGSGSAVHQIDRSRHQNMHSEIMSGIFGDIPQISSDLLKYVEGLIAPMIDGKDDTSALWASRIAIARLVYALTEGKFKGTDLGDKSVRSELAGFIAEGLNSAVQKFDLKNGKYENQLLLPTTLALIRFGEQEHSVIAETVWAGDSRCYALTPSGLKLLSVDDEDDSGSITNLFYADNDRIRLNYLRHEIQKPCILMAVSDGIFDPFDPYDHLGVEHTLLSAIAASDSEQELADRLHGFFDRVHGDDATMAFASFGFYDFADMKKVLKERTEKILTIRQKQAEMYSALEVSDLSEEEATHYVACRTADRYDHIASALTEAIEQGIDDVAIPAEVHSMVAGMQKTYKAAIEKARKEKRELAFSELDKFVLSHPELVISEILTCRPIKFNDQSFRQFYLEFKKTANELAMQLSRGGDEGRREEEFAAQKQDLHELIQAQIIAHRKKFDDLWNEQDPVAAQNRTQALDILSVWCRIDNSLKFGWGLQNIGRLPVKERGLAYAVQNFNSNYRMWRLSRNSRQAAIERIRATYESSWKRLYERLKRSEKLTKTILSSETLQRFGLDESEADAALSVVRGIGDSLKQEFIKRKPAIVSGILEALANGYNKTSVIDSQYNATKLNLFRTYYKLRNDPNNGVKQFGKELLALKAGYTSLVDHGGL